MVILVILVFNGFMDIIFLLFYHLPRLHHEQLYGGFSYEITIKIISRSTIFINIFHTNEIFFQEEQPEMLSSNPGYVFDCWHDKEVKRNWMLNLSYAWSYIKHYRTKGRNRFQYNFRCFLLPSSDCSIVLIITFQTSTMIIALL